MQFRARRDLSPSCKVHRQSNLNLLSSLHGSLAIKPTFILLSQSSSAIKLRFTLLVAYLTGNQTNVYRLVLRFKSLSRHAFGIEFTLEIREFGLRCPLKPPKEPMGNKQRMPIRPIGRMQGQTPCLSASLCQFGLPTA